jgi:hypothetical protein
MITKNDLGKKEIKIIRKGLRFSQEEYGRIKKRIYELDTTFSEYIRTLISKDCGLL